jgi:hypothetical protein
MTGVDDWSTAASGWSPAAINAILFCIGALWWFCGYRLFKATLFTAGFLCGGSFVYGTAFRVISDNHLPNETRWAFIAACIVGVLFGILAVWLFKAGLFLIGAGFGVLFGSVLNATFLSSIVPAAHATNVGYAVMALLGLAFGLIMIFVVQKPFLIFETSWVGAYLMLKAVGFYAGGFPNAFDMDEYLLPHILPPVNGTVTPEPAGGIPSSWWYYLVGIGLMTIAGCVVQHRITAKGVHHDQADHRRRAKRGDAYELM